MICSIAEFIAYEARERWYHRCECKYPKKKCFLICASTMNAKSKLLSFLTLVKKHTVVVEHFVRPPFACQHQQPF